MKWYREGELYNGRWAMAAVAGILFTDALGLPKFWEAGAEVSGRKGLSQGSKSQRKQQLWWGSLSWGLMGGYISGCAGCGYSDPPPVETQQQQQEEVGPLSVFGF